MSIFRLSDQDIEKCKKYGWKYLTQDFIDEIKNEGSKKAKTLAKSLQDIIDQEFEVEEEDGDEEENEDEQEENEVEEEDEEEEENEDEQDEEEEEDKNSVYYTVNVPCSTEDEDCEYEVPCKFKNKAQFEKIKKAFKNSKSAYFDELCSQFNEWLEENTEDGSCVSDAPKIGEKLTKSKKEDYLKLK